MDRLSISKRITSMIEEKKPIIGASIGNGRSAKQARRGGADILATLSAGRFRMGGVASIACTLPFGNSNDITFQYATKEVVSLIDDIPVLFGACAQDPTYGKDQLVNKVMSSGFDGLVNFPTVSLIDGQFREAIEESGEGFEHEVELLKKAHEAGLYTVAFAVSMEEAIQVVNVGVDVLCLHYGWTYSNKTPAIDFDMYIDRLINQANLIFDEAKKVNPDIILMIYGGSFVLKKDVIKRFYEETSAVGYFGGSVFDTLPTMDSMKDATESFKTMNRVSLLEMENETLRNLLKDKNGIKSIVGNSKQIVDLVNWIEKISKHDANILIEGEIGTGKNLVVKAIHYNSERATFPIKKVNCSSIPKHMIESELFGHEIGAFVGAQNRHIGHFEAANDGTLFLENVDELDLDTQAKLLRVIKDNEMERLGGSRTIRLNVRIVSTTTRNLKEEMLKGNFREDLFYLLNVLYRKMPSLREHKEDIPLYVAAFLEQINDRHHRVVELSSIVMDAFMKYDWPGNVRELKNTLERGVILCETKQIDVSCLPLSLNEYIDVDEPSNYIKNSSMLVEKELILHELLKVNWNQTKVAAKMGISRRTLYNKLKKYGLSKKDFIS